MHSGRCVIPHKHKTLLCADYAGAAFQYFVVGSTIWWFFHVCSIFLKMTVFVTPVYKKLELKIHIGLTVFGELREALQI